MPTKVCEMPKEIETVEGLKMMYEKRHLIFSKMDEGVILPDTLAWFEVTPEPNAIVNAQRFRGLKTVVDGFGGCGGNAIQIAKVVDKVYCIELSPVRLEAARNNARVYGVEHKIEFILGDFLKVAPTLKADAVNLCPPWAESFAQYCQLFKTFTLHQLLPVEGHELFKVARAISDNVCYCLPPTIPQDSLVKLAKPGEKVEFFNEPYDFFPGMIGAMTVYYGTLAKN